MKSKATVAIEIGERSIKLAAASISRKDRRVTLARIEAESNEDAAVSTGLKEIFSSLNIKEKTILVNVPRHLVITRFVKLPSTDDQELKTMIKMESVRQMPSTSEELVIGHKVLERRQDGYSDVLLAIAQGSIVNRIASVAKEAGLTIDKITIGSESLFAWRALSSGKERKDQAPEALVNIDSEHIDIDIIDKGRIVFARCVAIVPAGPERYKAITEEVGRTLATYHKETESRVGRLVLTGAAESIKTAEAALENEIKLSIEVVDQAKGVELDGRSKGDDLKTASFAELLGLLLKSDEIDINLLPEGVVKANETAALKINLKKTAVLSLCVAAAVSLIIIKNLVERSRFIALLDKEIKAMSPAVLRAKAMRDEINIMRSLVMKKPLAIDILSAVYKLTPQGTFLSMLDYDAGRVLVLKGSAPTLEDVVKYLSILEKSEYFENAKIKYTTKRTSEKVQMTDFEIVCSLSK